MGGEEVHHDRAPLAIVKGDQLPAVGVVDSIGRVHNPIHRVVGIGLTRASLFVAILVCAIAVAVVEQNPGHVVTNADWCCQILGGVRGVVPHPSHLTGKVVGEVGILVETGPIHRMGDGLLLVGHCPFGRRPSEGVTCQRCHGPVVVGGPGVVHRRDRDRHLPREDRRLGADPFHIAGRRLEHDLEPAVCR